MNIIILTKNDRIENQRYSIDDKRFIHIKNILKAEEGNVLEVGLLNGMLGTARIQSITDAKIILELVELCSSDDVEVNIELICALPRPQTLKKILNLSATMGIKNLFFIRSEKVEKSYFHSPLLLEENYTKYLLDGLAQGKRTHIPNVYFFKRFKKFFEEQFNDIDDKLLFVADQSADSYFIKDEIAEAKNITLAIGPEGGWNEFELNYMKERGFVPIKLSDSTLRVENAVNSALSQIELLINT